MTEGFSTGPGYDWEVAYRFDDGEPGTMRVFGQIRVEDAISEARFSLDGLNHMNVGTYEITSVART